MKLRMKWVCVILLFGMPIRAAAQDSEAASQRALIQQLLARIEKLETRVEELEGGRNAGRQGGAAQPAEAGIVAQTGHEGMPGMPGMEPQAMSPADTQPTYPSLKIAGFSDLNFSATDQRGVRSGFNEGQFVLHLSSALSPKVTYFGELSATARADAATGMPPATGFNLEIERSFVRFDESDRFKVSFGRFHTPITYWNSTFHHGTWLQTTVGRPEMMNPTGFIPIHFVGAMVEGALPSGGLNLNYNVGVGNGRGSIITRGGDAGDNNNNRAWLVNLFTKPSSLFGLVVGGSVYRDKITLPTGRDFREWISAGYIVWQKENPEVIAEFTNVNHHEIGRIADSNSQGFYIQVAYRLPWVERLWKPYYRYDYLHIPRSDVAFQAIPKLAGSAVGLRYDISNFASIKAEYRNQRRVPGLPRVNGAFLQTSFTF